MHITDPTQRWTVHWAMRSAPLLGVETLLRPCYSPARTGSHPQHLVEFVGDAHERGGGVRQLRLHSRRSPPLSRRPSRRHRDTLRTPRSSQPVRVYRAPVPCSALAIAAPRSPTRVHVMPRTSTRLLPRKLTTHMILSCASGRSLFARASCVTCLRLLLIPGPPLTSKRCTVYSSAVGVTCVLASSLPTDLTLSTHGSAVRTTTELRRPSASREQTLRCPGCRNSGRRRRVRVPPVPCRHPRRRWSGATHTSTWQSSVRASVYFKWLGALSATRAPETFTARCRGAGECGPHSEEPQAPATRQPGRARAISHCQHRLQPLHPLHSLHRLQTQTPPRWRTTSPRR